MGRFPLLIAALAANPDCATERRRLRLQDRLRLEPGRRLRHLRDGWRRLEPRQPDPDHIGRDLPGVDSRGGGQRDPGRGLGRDQGADRPQWDIRRTGLEMIACRDGSQVSGS